MTHKEKQEAALVAEKEVFRRIVTFDQAKENLKARIRKGLPILGAPGKSPEFWEEVVRQIDKVKLPETPEIEYMKNRMEDIC